MILDVQNKKAYAYTGGKPFDPSLPTAVFIHITFVFAGIAMPSTSIDWVSEIFELNGTAGKRRIVSWITFSTKASPGLLLASLACRTAV